jgi:AraC-like DNA-binding protein
VSQECEVRVRFYAPLAELRRYFTTFYLVETCVSGGGTVSDYLHPEWGNLRIHSGDFPTAETRSGTILSGTNFPVTGPSSEAIRFTIGTTRMWGVGLLPLGWAKFVHAPAAGFANAAVDGNRHAAFAGFAPLARTIFGDAPDPDGELVRLTNHFLDRIGQRVPDEERILAVHAALIDPENGTASSLARRANISPRTLERLCERAFGFPPKLLLRRQRFLRSLTQFILDPSLTWIGAMDSQYHDQAQFIRDFRQFMGMTPRQYAAMPKPILGAIMKERARFAGKALQALDGPEGGAVSD